MMATGANTKAEESPDEELRLLDVSSACFFPVLLRTLRYPTAVPLSVNHSHFLNKTVVWHKNSSKRT